MQYYREQYNDLQKEMKLAQTFADKFSEFGLEDDIDDQNTMNESMMDSFVSAVAMNESTIKQVNS